MTPFTPIAFVPACRFALPKRVLPRRVVVCASPELGTDPEGDDEDLHFIPVPQAIVVAIMRAFIGFLEFINTL